MTHLFAATSHDERFARGQAFAAAWLQYRTERCDVAGALRFFLHLGFELSYATRATYSGGAWHVLPNTPPGAPSRPLS